MNISGVTTALVIVSILLIIATVSCVAMALLFEEKAMTVKNHIKDIIRHDNEIRLLMKDKEDSYWKDSVNEEVAQILSHALDIKHTLTDTK